MSVDPDSTLVESVRRPPRRPNTIPTTVTVSEPTTIAVNTMPTTATGPKTTDAQTVAATTTTMSARTNIDSVRTRAPGLVVSDTRLYRHETRFA
jgi:hypothetical protein